MDLYHKACDLNNSQACNSVGIMYQNGEGVKRNYDSAYRYYVKACDMGFEFGCSNADKINDYVSDDY